MDPRGSWIATFFREKPGFLGGGSNQDDPSGIDNQTKQTWADLQRPDCHRQKI